MVSMCTPITRPSQHGRITNLAWRQRRPELIFPPRPGPSSHCNLEPRTRCRLQFDLTSPGTILDFGALQGNARVSPYRAQAQGRLL
jgi:hypothetical protein